MYESTRFSVYRCPYCSGLHFASDYYCDLKGTPLARLEGLTQSYLLKLGTITKGRLERTIFHLINSGAGRLDIQVKTDDASSDWLKLKSTDISLLAGVSFPLNVIIDLDRWEPNARHKNSLIIVHEMYKHLTHPITLEVARELPTDEGQDERIKQELAEEPRLIVHIPQRMIPENKEKNIAHNVKPQPLIIQGNALKNLEGKPNIDLRSEREKQRVLKEPTLQRPDIILPKKQD